MKQKIFSFSTLLLAGLFIANSANAQWTRNAITSQTYLTNIADKVGIGTTTPAYKLDIQGTGITTMSFKSNNDNASILLDRGASNKTSSLTYRTAGINNWQTGCVSSNNYTIRNNGLGALTFYCDYLTNNIGIGTNVPFAPFTVATSSGLVNRGIWSAEYSTGNLGAIIGGRRSRGTETAPTAVGSNDWGAAFVSEHYDGANYLQNGSFGYRITGSAAAGNIPGEWYIGASNTDDHDPYQNGHVRMVVQSSGNIGIGTTAPAAKLDIAGNIKITDGTQGAGKVLTSDANGLSSWQAPSGGSGQWTTSGNNIFNNNSGNVGIGTSLPNAPLQFATSNQKRKIVLFETANNDNQFYGFGVFGGELRYQTGVLTDDHVFYSGASSSVSNELLRIKGNGNVGIGTASPQVKLDVGGIIQASGNICVDAAQANTGTGTTNTLKFGGNGSGEVIGSKRNAGGNQFGLDFFTASTNRMSITNGGFVGIGTTTPSSQLEVVANNGQTNAAIRNTGTGNVGLELRGNSTGSLQFIDFQDGATSASTPDYRNRIISSTGNLTFATSSVGNALVLLNNGNLGIGTTPTSYKLEVCGTIRSNEVRVETGWCDYVFANDYKLAPLSEVESFIKANKHLPDVTSGAEIETNGLEVGKVSAQMIKKIEELTLYVIEQEKAINKLKAQNEKLEAKMNSTAEKGGK